MTWASNFLNKCELNMTKLHTWQSFNDELNYHHLSNDKIMILHNFPLITITFALTIFKNIRNSHVFSYFADYFPSEVSACVTLSTRTL